MKKNKILLENITL